MHKKANVCLIHPQRNKPGEGNTLSFHFCPFKGRGGFHSDLLIQQFHIKFPLSSFLDNLEYFQVDGSVNIDATCRNTVLSRL